MERELVRRPSFSESTASSGCDVTFDDVDDSHVFAYLDDGDDQGSQKAASPRTVEFRLDFSSRVNPSPLTVSTSQPSTGARRSSTTSLPVATKQSSMSHANTSAPTGGRILQRSPSMRTNAQPFRRRVSRRPSEPAPDNAIVAAAIAKVIAVRPESPPSSPTSTSSSPPRVDAAPMPAGQTTPKASAISRSSAATMEDAMAAEHNAALTAAALELKRLQAENETLREDLHTVQSEATELLKRLRLAEQQNETLSDQLIAVQEAYEDKLRSVHDDAGAEREQWENQRTLELQALRERSEQEREMLEREMKAAVAKIESDLQSDADQLQRLLRDGKDQTNALKTQIAMLQTELKTARAERQQQTQSDASLATKCESLQRSHDHWEAKCQNLQDQVHQLLHEHDDWRRQAAVEKQEREQKKNLQRTTCERLASQVRVLQTQLRTLATGTRELIQSELKKSTQLLAQWQQHASEVAIQHNDKAMALVAKQNRIIQLESQLKNERQSVVQLDASLAKTTRALQRKDELFRAKYQEQKEFLDITVAVRNGLTHELQSKKQKLDQLEMRLRDAGLACDAADKKNKLLVQQVKIMQHAHAREMEQVALGRQHEQCTTRRRSSDAPKSRRPSLRGSAAGHKPLRTADTTTHAAAPTDWREREEDEHSGRRWLPEDAAEEWRDFVEVVALHQAECRYQQQHRK